MILVSYFLRGIGAFYDLEESWKPKKITKTLIEGAYQKNYYQIDNNKHLIYEDLKVLLPADCSVGIMQVEYYEFFILTQNSAWFQDATTLKQNKNFGFIGTIHLGKGKLSTSIPERLKPDDTFEDIEKYNQYNFDSSITFHGYSIKYDFFIVILRAEVQPDKLITIYAIAPTIELIHDKLECISDHIEKLES